MCRTKNKTAACISPWYIINGGVSVKTSWLSNSQSESSQCRWTGSITTAQLEQLQERLKTIQYQTLMFLRIQWCTDAFAINNLGRQKILLRYAQGIRCHAVSQAGMLTFERNFRSQYFEKKHHNITFFFVCRSFFYQYPLPMPRVRWSL